MAIIHRRIISAGRPWNWRRAVAGLASPNPHGRAPSLWMSADALWAAARIVYAEMKHAEVLAIEQAGPLARGNTLYLNLEPCSHTGRTGPAPTR